MAALIFGLLLLALPSLGSTQNLPKSIFLLAGQSNMAGRGGLINNKWDGVVPIECASSPRIVTLNATLGWEEAREPLHAAIDINKPCGIGPGMIFANLVLQRHKEISVIGLVPCAVGGTKIAQWSKGNLLYKQLLTRAEASLHAGSGEIKAMLWFQGEADTEDPADANAYKLNLEKFFNDLRLDLKMPTLPIYQVALASGVHPAEMETVRQAQLSIKLPNVKTVDALGIPLTSDNLHLSRDGQIQLGKKLADAFP